MGSHSLDTWPGGCDMWPGSGGRRPGPLAPAPFAEMSPQVRPALTGEGFLLFCLFGEAPGLEVLRDTPGPPGVSSQEALFPPPGPQVCTWPSAHHGL